MTARQRDALEWDERWDDILGLFLDLRCPRRGGWLKILPPEYYSTGFEELTCIREQLIGTAWEEQGHE